MLVYVGIVLLCHIDASTRASSLSIPKMRVFELLDQITGVIHVVVFVVVVEVRHDYSENVE